MAYSDVQKKMLEARMKNKRILDRKAALQAFKPGDRVFYQTPITDQNASSKLTSKWTKVGVLRPVQQPGSYWDRSSELPLVGLEPTEVTAYD